MPFELIRNDITRMHTDAIVNAANSALRQGGGVCGAIFHAAGAEELQRACDLIGSCPTGSAVLTPGFRLPARYVIHAVGPMWHGGTEHEPELLHSAYRSALRVAHQAGCRSISFPLISAGIYGYPVQAALSCAVSAIRDFLEQHDMMIYLVLFDRAALAAGESRYSDLRSFIDDHYVEHYPFFRRWNEARSCTPDGESCTLEDAPFAPQDYAPMAAKADFHPQPMAQMAAPAPKERKSRSLKDLLNHLDESFSRMLLRLIDEKGMTDVEVYKRANLDRKLFSKLRKDGYTPSKVTAIALAVALQLNLDETKDFLAKAGYALSRNNKFDVIIEYFITNRVYDIFEINEALFAFDQKLLGA